MKKDGVKDEGSITWGFIQGYSVRCERTRRGPTESTFGTVPSLRTVQSPLLSETIVLWIIRTSSNGYTDLAHQIGRTEIPRWTFLPRLRKGSGTHQYSYFLSLYTFLGWTEGPPFPLLTHRPGDNYGKRRVWGRPQTDTPSLL